VSEASVVVDPQRGARVASLVDRSGYEWLWSRPDPRRDAVRPGSAFVDVGGVEECFPTLTGSPDHGDVWTRPWSAVAEQSWVCATGDARLIRSHRIDGDMVTFAYRLEAPPGFGFVWAFHAMLGPAPGTRLDVPGGSLVVTWPNGSDTRRVEHSWPIVDGTDLREIPSTDDGTGAFCLLPGSTALTVHQPGRHLHVELDAGGQPGAIGIWRNWRGYAWDGGAPYRSFGVEPMLGRNPAASAALPAERAVVGESGVVEWGLRLTLSVDGASPW
jgi:hypothetical protein